MMTTMMTTIQVGRVCCPSIVRTAVRKVAMIMNVYLLPRLPRATKRKIGQNHLHLIIILMIHRDDVDSPVEGRRHNQRFLHIRRSCSLCRTGLNA